MNPTSPKTAVRRLALARLISVTGSAAAYTALMDAVFRRTGGSPGWLVATLLVTFGASGLLGPIGGALGDRFDRRRLMIISDLLGAGAFLALAFAHAPRTMLSIAFVSAVVETPFWAASAAAIPNLVEEKDLSWANGLLTMGANAGITVGPALGGVLSALIGHPAVFVANAVSFAVSAALVATVHGRFQAERSPEHEHKGLRAGFVFLFRDRVLRTVTFAWVTLVAGAGMGMVADRPLAEVFHAGAVGFGAIIGLWGFGAVVGSFLGRRMSEQTEPRWIVGGFLIITVCGAVMGLSPWFLPILVSTFFWGLADGLGGVADQSIRQRRTPDVVRSRVVAASEALVNAAQVASYLLAGVVLGAIGPQRVYLLGGLASAGAALVVWPTARRLRARARAAAVQRSSPGPSEEVQESQVTDRVSGAS